MGEKETPKVSVLVPVYNMERFLAQCLDALCGQTLEDIEIIAINDGSTDSSPEILARYAADDPRIRVIDKANSGYGASMNRGLDEARGDYIGIVEPDDYPDLVMFEKLYHAAETNRCDLVKCNFYDHYDDREEVRWTFKGFDYGIPFDPADRPSVICTVPSIWAALYRRSFIEESAIRFRETPGASFQDTGFTLKAWFAANRAVLVRRPLLHYRMDNPGSSTKTRDKAMAVCGELAEAEEFLRARPIRHGAFAPWLNVDKWAKYRWNYGRMDVSLRSKFAHRMHDEFLAAYEAGEVALELFGENSRVQVSCLLVSGADEFARLYSDGIAEDWEDDPNIHDVSPAVRAFADGQVVGVSSPAITVIVAACNCESFIGDCIESLKSQTYGDFEVIVVDDASTDSTVELVRKRTSGDNRFTLVERSENGGPGAACNDALAVARGEYVMCVGAEDLLAADALEKIMTRVSRQKLDELYFSVQPFHQDGAASKVMCEDFNGLTPYEGVATGPELFAFFSERGESFSQGALRVYRRDLIEREGIRYLEGVMHEDVLFGFRVLAASNRSSFLNESIYLRRQRLGSNTRTENRPADNVRGYVECILRIRQWVYGHAADLDSVFLCAIGREVGSWSHMVARDWYLEMTELERASLLEGFDDGERYAVLFGIIGMGSASERVVSKYRGSMAYRLGDAIATVPRAVCNRFTAIGRRFRLR